MINIILIVILLCIAGGIVLYLYKAKKRGETCIGCPYARQCAKQHGGTCSCHDTRKTDINSPHKLS